MRDILEIAQDCCIAESTDLSVIVDWGLGNYSSLTDDVHKVLGGMACEADIYVAERC